MENDLIKNKIKSAANQNEPASKRSTRLAEQTEPVVIFSQFR